MLRFPDQQDQKEIREKVEIQGLPVQKVILVRKDLLVVQEHHVLLVQRVLQEPPVLLVIPEHQDRMERQVRRVPKEKQDRKDHQERESRVQLVPMDLPAPQDQLEQQEQQAIKVSQEQLGLLDRPVYKDQRAIRVHLQKMENKVQLVILELRATPDLLGQREALVKTVLPVPREAMVSDVCHRLLQGSLLTN